MVTLSQRVPGVMSRPFARRESEPQYEMVVLYDSINDPPVARLVELPGHEIQAHLDHRSRYKSTSGKHYIVSVVLAVTVAVAAIFALFFALATPPFGALVLALFLGPPPGAVMGFIFAHKLKPKPIWTMRRYWRMDNEDEASLIVESMVHSQFTHEEYVVEKWKDSDGKEQEQLIPQIYRATSTYEMTEARDEKEDFKGKGNSIAKIELGLAAMTALASVGLLIFFAVITQQPGG